IALEPLETVSHGMLARTYLKALVPPVSSLASAWKRSNNAWLRLPAGHAGSGYRVQARPAAPSLSPSPAVASCARAAVGAAARPIAAASATIPQEKRPTRLDASCRPGRGQPDMRPVP